MTHAGPRLTPPIDALEAQTASTRPSFKQRLLGLVAYHQLAVCIVIFFGLVVTICNQLSTAKEVEATLPLAVQAVSGYYGPGMYYGWTVNGVAAVCQSKPNRTRGPRQDGRARYKRTYQNVSTLVVAIYAWAAAIDELHQIKEHKPFSPSRMAADRVCQAAWIFATLYLLHHVFSGRLRPIRRPSFQTAVWIIVWIMTTASKSADRITRHVLVVTTQKVLIPFIVGILFPQLLIYLLNHIGAISRLSNNSDRHTAGLNLSTMVISLTYAVMPRRWRYDPDSPAAPLSAHSLGDLEQAVALATGLTIAIPLLLAMWKKSRHWAIDMVEKAIMFIGES